MRMLMVTAGLIAYGTVTGQAQTHITPDAKPDQKNQAGTPVRGVSFAGESVKRKRTPQQVLELIVGAWDVEATIIQPKGDAGTQKQTSMYISKNTWSPNQQFVIGSNTNDDGVSVATYDPRKQNYRYAFVSPYFTSNFSGDWDDAKQIMTWKGKHDDGNTMTGTLRIIDNNRHESVIRVMDSRRLVVELRHRSTRRKE